MQTFIALFIYYTSNSAAKKFKEKNLMGELRPHERKTLLVLKELGGKANVNQLTTKSGLSEAALMRAALVLQDQKLVEIRERKQTILTITQEGKIYAKKGLPERQLINVLLELKSEAPLKKVIKKAGLRENLVPIALGWLRRKGWAKPEKGYLKILKPPEKEGFDEKLLKLLGKKLSVIIENLDPEMRKAAELLKRRKLVEMNRKTVRTLEITRKGLNLIKRGVHAATEISQLTPEIIVSGKWRKAKLRKYNIKAPVAKTWPGKKHPYLRFIDEVKRKLVALGFKEMYGPLVELSFFNFDALFMPQDHPAREIFGIYFVKSPKHGNLSRYKKVVTKVKETHENGWKTGSKGWGYKYSVREASRLILRGHGTALSVRTLISKDLEIPGKYFSIARCYRPEVVDKTHLTEFNQVEGIVVDENITLRDLLGVLEKFAIEIAEADKVKFRPDYFPFTEPSVELSAYKEGYGWIEFGGSGIFRPEVTLPLGIKVPVIAWGLGIDRLFMMRAGIDDIRYVFTQDLDWIRRKGRI